MSDEEIVNNEVVEVAAEAEPVVLTIDDKARAMGWRPEAEYKGDKDNWVDAKEFVSRSSFFKKIDSLNEKIKTQDAVLKTMHQTLSETEKRAYLKASEDINHQLREAREAGDFDAYEQATARKAQLTNQVQQIQQLEQKPVVAQITEMPFWKEFLVQNPWYNQNDLDSQIKRASAKIAVDNFERDNPGVDPSESTKYITKFIKEKFPSKEKSNSSPDVATGSKSKASSQDTVDLSGLNTAQRQALEYYKNNKMDTNELMKQFKKGK